MRERLADLRARGELSALDLHFAEAVGRWSGQEWTAVLAAAWTSRAAARGHACLDLAAAAEELRDLGVTVPAAAEWSEALRASPVVGASGAFTPLVLTAGRIYLHRYWSYEERVATLLRERASALVEYDEASVRPRLERLFPSPPGTPGEPMEPDRQKLAAAVALSKRLCILAGGPGTGKTTTVARLLALLLEVEGPQRIALAASTGKAAARLQDSLRSAKERLGLPEELAALLPDEACTLHRLLGARTSGGYRFDASTPLPHDVVVVDEVSMVDLSLMASVCSAVAPRARLILLGDRDQLASVQAGSVLSDLCGPGADAHAYSVRFSERLARLTGEPPEAAKLPAGPLADCLVFLRRSYRFDSRSGIARFSLAVQRADEERASAVLGESWPDLRWRSPPRPEHLARELAPLVVESFGACFETVEPAEAFRRFEAFRILCAHREGPFGAVAVNRAVEKVLHERGLAPRREWYPGRPVMVLRNDYGLRLANGDVGLVLPDPESGGALRAFFPASDGGPAFRKLPLLHLPSHETCYAMTVHKSQGSEFDRVLLLLGDRPSRVLTRELLYTGATRTRRALELWGSEEALAAGIARGSERASGLAEALWG